MPGKGERLSKKNLPQWEITLSTLRSLQYNTMTLQNHAGFEPGISTNSDALSHLFRKHYLILIKLCFWLLIKNSQHSPDIAKGTPLSKSPWRAMRRGLKRTRQGERWRREGSSRWSRGSSSTSWARRGPSLQWPQLSGGRQSLLQLAVGQDGSVTSHFSGLSYQKVGRGRYS